MHPLHVDSDCGGKAEAAFRKKTTKEPASFFFFFLYNCRLLPFILFFLFTFFVFVSL